MKLITLLLIAIGLVACASNTGIIPMGRDIPYVFDLPSVFDGMASFVVK